MEALFWDSKPRELSELAEDDDVADEPKSPPQAMPAAISVSPAKPSFPLFGAKGPAHDYDDVMSNMTIDSSIAATGEFLRKIGREREALSQTQSSLMRAIGLRLDGSEDVSEAHRVYAGSVQNAGK
jgi:hypothetical protein